MPKLYENNDGFTIQKRSGDPQFYSKVLKLTVEIYGLSESPNYEELSRIARVVLNYIDTPSFDGRLIYPVYPNASYLQGIIKIARLMTTIGKRKRGHKKFIHSIMDKFEKEDWDYYTDMISR